MAIYDVHGNVLSESDIVVDNTLKKSGQAADAKITGDRLDSLSEEMLTEESDPTVPSWAKAAQKPSYTASEVGADPSGTAAAQVAAHNSGTDTHSDIRVLIQGLTDRLNALADSDDTTLDQLSEVVSYIKSNRTLIEAITTSKVSVADIIDNLTTNVTNKPLSAAQGVALKALIDAITIPEALPNPNALTFTGSVTGIYDGSAPLSVEIPSGGSGSSAIELVYQHICDGTYVSVTDDLPLENGKVYLTRITLPIGSAKLTARCLIGSQGNTYTGAVAAIVVDQHAVTTKQVHSLMMKTATEIVGISYFGANLPEIAGYNLGQPRSDRIGDKIYFYSTASDINLPDGTTVEVYRMN